MKTYLFHVYVYDVERVLKVIPRIFQKYLNFFCLYFVFRINLVRNSDTKLKVVLVFDKTLIFTGIRIFL